MVWLLKSYIPLPLGVRGLLLRVALLGLDKYSLLCVGSDAHSCYNCAQEKCVQGMQVPLNPESQ